MSFADLKNDFVFRRIFATHPEILRSLLNDLLERSGKDSIVSIEYLPSEQLPLVVGAKLSILDVRCKDQAGATFVVEMQLIHVPGPYREALELANKATFTQEELDAYQKVRDEIQQVRDLVEAKWAEGRVMGRAEGQVRAILMSLSARGIAVSDENRGRIEACKDEEMLDRWIVKAASAATVDEVIGRDDKNAPRSKETT